MIENMGVITDWATYRTRTYDPLITNAKKYHRKEQVRTRWLLFWL